MAERIKELDGLRAAAILLVVAWHYLGVPEWGQPLFRILIFGRTGVDLFFVLSGYLITRILLNSVGSPGYFSTFYRRRAFRILPIYAVMVLIYLVGRNLRGSAPALFDGSMPWWSYLVGLQNFWMAAQQTYGAAWLAGTWSLAVEEQFYLLFPLVVMLAGKRLPYVLVALLVFCPIGRVIAYVYGDRFGYYVLMPLRADILAVGALIAWLQFNKRMTDVAPAARNVLRASLVLFPLFAFLLGVNAGFHMAVWGHVYLGALFGSILFTVIQVRGSCKVAFLRTRPAAFFARISYALYLVHGGVLMLIFMAFRTPHTVTTWQGAALTAFAFALSVLICAASYRYFEAPLIARGIRSQ